MEIVICTNNICLNLLFWRESFSQTLTSSIVKLFLYCTQTLFLLLSPLRWRETKGSKVRPSILRQSVRPSVTLTKTLITSQPQACLTICLFITKLGWYMPYIGLHDILGSKVTLLGQRSNEVICEGLPARLFYGWLLSNHVPVCNQTWLDDAPYWPPWCSGVKGHISRLEVKWGQITILDIGSITLQPSRPLLGQTCMVSPWDLTWYNEIKGDLHELKIKQ